MSPLHATDLSPRMAKALGVKAAKPHKYNATRVWIDGIRFDSKREGERYGLLRMLEKSGEIDNLTPHPMYPITVKDVPICVYVADFRYRDRRSGQWRVEDVKSPATRTNRAYRLKKKLVEAIYGIQIQEV